MKIVKWFNFACFAFSYFFFSFFGLHFVYTPADEKRRTAEKNVHRLSQPLNGCTVRETNAKPIKPDAIDFKRKKKK